MKILFIAPLKELHNNFDSYQLTTNQLKKLKYTIVDDWISLIDHDNFEIRDLSQRREFFYENYREHLRKLDFLVAETSVYSRTVQYQIVMSLLAGIKTVCIKRKSLTGKISLIDHIKDKNLSIYIYSDLKNLETIIQQVF